MEGSKKQIKWAEKIKANINGVLDACIENIDKDFATYSDSDKAQAYCNYEMTKRVIDSIDYAGDIIGAFKDVNTSNYQQAFFAIVSAINVDPKLHKIAAEIASEQ